MTNKAPLLRPFVDGILSDIYSDFGSFGDLCLYVTGRGTDAYFGASLGLEQIAPRFLDKVCGSSASLARWIEHLLNHTNDDYQIRERLRIACCTREGSQQQMMLEPNNLVRLVCETRHVPLAEQLKKAIEQTDLQLVVDIFAVAPDEDMAMATSRRDRLKSSTLIIECRGSPDEVLPELDFAQLMSLATIKEYFVVNLPGYLGPVMQDVPTINLHEGLDNAGKLIAEAFAYLKPLKGRAGGPGKPQPEPKTAELRLAALAENIVNNGLVVCVGGDLPERRSALQPSPDELAVQLLIEANLLDPKAAAEAVRREPLVSSVWAGFLNRFTNTDGSLEEIKKWKRNLAERLRNRVGPTPSLTSLAQMLLTIQKDPPQSGDRLVIVTTNVDLALESAFIEAGLAFEAQVVSPRTRKDEEQLPYSALFEEMQVVRGVASVSGIAEESISALSEQRRADCARDYERDVSDGALSFDEYLQRRCRNKMISDIYDRGAKLELQRASNRQVPAPLADTSANPTLPLVIKLNGSCHRDGDFVAAADEDRYARERLPKEMRNGITNAAMVLMGYGVADPLLTEFHASVLRGPFRLGTKADRVALVDPRDKPASLTSAWADPMAKLKLQGAYLGLEVVSTPLEPGLKAIAESYTHAIQSAAI